MPVQIQRPPVPAQPNPVRSAHRDLLRQLSSWLHSLWIDSDSADYVYGGLHLRLLGYLLTIGVLCVSQANHGRRFKTLQWPGGPGSSGSWS